MEGTSVPPIQDLNKPPIMVGRDVRALYPSLDVVTASCIAARAVEDTKIRVQGGGLSKTEHFLTLMLGTSAMIKHGLHDAVAERADDSKGESLACKANRDLTGWVTGKREFELSTRKKMLLVFIQVLTTIMMSSHCYSYGGKLYIQCIGADIGLRASACLARIIMCTWDTLWAKYQIKAGFRALLFVCYVDDLRLFVFPINPG